MGTQYLVKLFWETTNEDGELIWRRLHYTRARRWEDAMDTFRKRIGSQWGLPFSEDSPDRYLLQMSAYGTKHPALDMTRAVKKRLRELAEKRFRSLESKANFKE